jgi:hypothetical protein
MKRTSIQHAWLWLAALALLPRIALAQDEVSSESTRDGDVVSTEVDSPDVEAASDTAWTYPKSYSVRPLTLQKGMVRANGIVTVWDDGVDTLVGLTLGGSIGVTDDLELGINNYRVGSSLQDNYEGLVALTFAPSVGYGDIPVYGRYRFLHREKLDVAGDVIFVIPVDSTFAFQGDVPLRIKPNDRLSVDTGVEVRGTFGSAKRADIRIPAIVNYNFSDRAFIAGETGLWFVNMGKSYNTPPNDSQGMDIPVGFRAGGTWKKSDKQIVDLFAGFAFPALIETGTSRSTFDGGIWDIYVGVAFNTRPLF